MLTRQSIKQNLVMSIQLKIVIMITSVFFIVRLMVTSRLLQYEKNINLIGIQVVSTMLVTITKLSLAMIVYMQFLLCLHRSKIYFPYRHFIMMHCCIQLVSIPPYRQICNIINTTSQFRQILHVFHYGCKPIPIINMDNKGIKVTYGRLTHINGLSQILYFWGVVNDHSFVFIKVKATFVVSRTIFIHT